MSTPEETIDEESGGALAQYARRAPRISREDVFQSADALLVQGDRPTIDRVRMKLGRGSPNTINDHLDAWWLKLGARLRDIPGQEFPQVPERVSQALLQLWDHALEGAHSALRETAAQREQTLIEQEATLESATQALHAREVAAAAGMAALEEALALARDQLAATNQRANALEARMQERDAECDRLRGRIGTLETDCHHYRTQLDAASTAHQAERTQLQERHATTEAHWMLELDRARQSAKELTKTHERQVKELRAAVVSVKGERDKVREALVETRAELKAATALCARLEQPFRREPAAAPRAVKTRPASKSKPRRS